MEVRLLQLRRWAVLSLEVYGFSPERFALTIWSPCPLASPRPASAEPSDWVSTTTVWLASYGREILTGWLSNRLPISVWLPNEVPACRVSSVVLLKGGANASVLKSDMPTSVPTDSDKGAAW